MTTQRLLRHVRAGDIEIAVRHRVAEWWEVRWCHTLQPVTERYESRARAAARHRAARDVYHDSDVRLVHVTRWKVTR